MLTLRLVGASFTVGQYGKEIEPKALKATPGSADICFVSDNSISDIISHLESYSITIEKEPMLVTGALGEMESIWFRDPDGNLIEISNYNLK
ncbi:MAG: VOC family protein [Gammaproteobacteria bacterium]